MNAQTYYAVAFLGTVLNATITPDKANAEHLLDHARTAHGANPDNYSLVEVPMHEYLCGCFYPTKGKSAYFDWHCAKCHRELWTASRHKKAAESKQLSIPAGLADPGCSAFPKPSGDCITDRIKQNRTVREL